MKNIQNTEQKAESLAISRVTVSIFLMLTLALTVYACTSGLPAQSDPLPSPVDEQTPVAAPASDNTALSPSDTAAAEPKPGDNTTLLPQGETKTFEFADLSFRVTNVVSEATRTGTDDMGDQVECPVYLLSTGAELTVIDAAMTDGSLTESGVSHPNWYVYLESGDKIPLTDDMEPLELNEDMTGVINGESSAYVLIFGFAD